MFKRTLTLLFLSLISSSPAWALQESLKTNTQKANHSQIRLAILPFEGRAPLIPDQKGVKQIAEGLPGVLTTSLLESGKYLLVERNQLKKVMKEQAFQASAFSSQEQVSQFGEILGVQKILLGEIQLLNDSIRISGRVLDVKTGQIEKSATVTGSLSELFALQDQLADALLDVELSNQGEKAFVPQFLLSTDQARACSVSMDTAIMAAQFEGFRDIVESTRGVQMKSLTQVKQDKITESTTLMSSQALFKGHIFFTSQIVMRDFQSTFNTTSLHIANKKSYQVSDFFLALEQKDTQALFEHLAPIKKYMKFSYARDEKFEKFMQASRAKAGHKTWKNHYRCVSGTLEIDPRIFN